MPFESGSFALATFRLPEKMPEDFLEKFNSQAAGKLDDVKDEPSIGWVSGRHLLETDINEVTSIFGGYLYAYMRIAERKIPSTLLKAITKREELAYMQAENVDNVPSKIKKLIKEDAADKFLMKMPPTISGIPMAIDSKANLLYFGGSSASQIDNFVALFIKTVNFEPIQVNLQEMMFRVFKKDILDLPSISFTEESQDDEPSPERDFLTWLWYHSETDEGRVNVPDLGNFNVMIEGPLTFAFALDDAKGAGETTVKKGCPMRSAEAKAAVIVGKKLKKAKLTLVKEQDVWTGTFDADKFAFSGFSLPEGEEMEQHSRFAERMNNLFIFNKVIEECFKIFVDTLQGKNWAKTEQKIQKWVQDRDSL